MESRRALERFLRHLEHSTSTALRHLTREVQREPGLLDGQELFKLWQQYYEDRLPKTEPGPPYGLYLFFVSIDDAHVPLYVGKGKLPERPLAHLGPVQFVDQLFAYAFGGTHRKPWDGDRRDKVVKALSGIRTGFFFTALGTSSGGLPGAAVHERKLQNLLRPVADGLLGFKPTQLAGGDWDLASLARRWLEELQSNLDDTALEALGATLRVQHEAVLADRDG